jgi:hypothetical protein
MNEIPKFTTVKGLTVANVLQVVGRATTSALVKLTGRPIRSVLPTVNTLHARSKVHIGSYELSSRGKVSRVWHWGDGDDARAPSTAEHKNGFIPRPDEAAAWLRNPI